MSSVNRDQERSEASGPATDSLVRTEYLQPGQTLPLVIQPRVKGMNPITWAATHKSYIEANLLTYGGLLFRNFGMKTATEFEQFSTVVCGDLLEYNERSSPRRQVRGNVYTSTDYPPSESIFLHNENSYQQTWPMRILFFCQTAPPGGGETPIADCRKIYQRLNAKLRERFIQLTLSFKGKANFVMNIDFITLRQESAARLETFQSSAKLLLSYFELVGPLMNNASEKGTSTGSGFIRLALSRESRANSIFPRFMYA